MLNEASQQFITAIRVERGELWPCGHPRIPENTQSIGKAGVRCRECRRKIARRYAAAHRDKQRLRRLPEMIAVTEKRLRSLKNEQRRLSQ